MPGKRAVAGESRAGEHPAGRARLLARDTRVAQQLKRLDILRGVHAFFYLVVNGSKQASEGA